MSISAVTERETRLAIDCYLDQIYEQSQQLAEELVKAGFSPEKSKTQLRGLETLVNATGRFSEIINFIKNQAGKESKENKWRTVAPRMLQDLKKLEEEAHTIGKDDPFLVMETKLRLARGWVRQVVCHVLYERPS